MPKPTAADDLMRILPDYRRQMYAGDLSAGMAEAIRDRLKALAEEVGIATRRPLDKQEFAESIKIAHESIRL